jgi:hypothetical protein
MATIAIATERTENALFLEARAGAPAMSDLLILKRA